MLERGDGGEVSDQVNDAIAKAVAQALEEAIAQTVAEKGKPARVAVSIESESGEKSVIDLSKLKGSAKD